MSASETASAADLPNPSPPANPPELTGLSDLAELVPAAAAARPDHPALLTASGVGLTWAQLNAEVTGCAQRLAGLGLRPGDRVVLHLGNVPEFAVAWFAAQRAGLVAVPTNPVGTRDELRHVLADSGARAVLTSRAGSALVQALGDDRPATGTPAALPALDRVVVVDGPAPAGARALADLPRASLPGPPDPDRLAAVLYTSGTSGRPRGAMLPARALRANLEQCLAIDPPAVTANDVVLGVLPLFHVFGLNGVLGAAARTAATVLLVERFDPVETLELVRRHRVTAVLAAPPVYVAWSLLPEAAVALQGVRLALSGAAPLPLDVADRLRERAGLTLFEGYGLTETSPVVTTTLASDEPKPGSVGRPVPLVELRLVDEQGAPVDEGDPGEVLVRGPNVFSGYWPDGADGPDRDGWYATGDVGHLDADGDLFLVGRRRDLVLVSGFNVYPREVERVLDQHPDVAESAVVGVPHPYTGESVKALVVPRPGTRPSAEELIAHCARALARFKCPTAVELVDTLPRGATGKVRKAVLRGTA